MEIFKNVNDSEMEVRLTGRLDTTTAPAFEEALKESIDPIEKLTLNFDGLEYVSSAGLRVILSAQKVMNKQGSMVIVNVCDDIKEVFDITGFSDILTIE